MEKRGRGEGGGGKNLQKKKHKRNNVMNLKMIKLSKEVQQMECLTEEYIEVTTRFSVW